eukprot:3791995-Pyramimonas_sp.AAC.1
MCLCDDGIAKRARNSFKELDTAEPDVKEEQVTKEEQRQVVAPSPKSSIFKRKGPAPTPLGHNRVDHHPDNAAAPFPKKARTKGEIVETKVLWVEWDGTNKEVHTETGPTTATVKCEATQDGNHDKHSQVSLPPSILQLLRATGIKNRKDVLRELICLRKVLALPPKKRYIAATIR